MPLYNNVRLFGNIGDKGSSNTTGEPSSSDANKPSTPSNTSMRFLHDHLLSKKRAKQLPSIRQIVHKQIEQSSNSENVLPIRRFCGEPCDWDPQDEYDPMAPNSYEILQSDYLKAEEQKLLAKRNKPPTKLGIDTSLLDAIDKLDGMDDVDIRSPRGTAIAPPPIMQAPNALDKSVQQHPPSETEQCIKPSDCQLTGEKLDVLSAAAKIMSKMGYKAGQGLGKDEQGLSALEVEAKWINSGKIIQGSRSSDQTTAVPNNASDQLNKPTRKPSRVILLQNMVGPGEVDEELETETKEECSKYGEVVKCLIYEIPNKRVPNDQAVRIFVEFVATDSAVKALNDLNGRYFGGRIVKATFYDVDQFNRYELGPSRS